MNILSYVSLDADLTTGYVYKWTNLINGKMYIGSHCGNNKYYITSGIIITEAIKKYGINKFVKELLYVGPNYRKVEEEILISIDAMYNSNYYNLSNASNGFIGIGAANGMYGRNHSKETIELIRKKKLGKTGKSHSLESRIKRSKSLMGHEISLETRKKISEANKGPSHGNHVRWHVNRNKYSPVCLFCM